MPDAWRRYAEPDPIVAELRANPRRHCTMITIMP